MKNRNHNSCRAFLAAGIYLITFGLTQAFGQASAEIQKLPVYQPLEREIKGGETHGYKINLQAGEFLRVRVEQRVVDIVLRLFAPDGKSLVERDRPNGKDGEESLSAEAGLGGEYRVEVAALKAGAATGKYSLRSERPRLATNADKRRIAAEILFQEAMKLRTSQTAESWRKALAKCEEALSAWQSLADDYAEALTLKNIGIIYDYLDEKQKALDSYNQSLSRARAAGDKSQEASILDSIGAVYYALGDYQKGLELYKQSLSLVRAIGNKGVQALVLNQEGRICGTSAPRRQY